MRLSPIVSQHLAETSVVVGWVEDKDVERRSGRHAASALASLGAHVTLVMAMALLRARLESGHLVHESSCCTCWLLACSCQSSHPSCLEVGKMRLK